MKEKMTEEELQELYEEELKSVDSEKISTKSGNSEALKTHKIKDLWLKSTAAVVLVATITAGGIKFSNNLNTETTPDEPTTSQGSTESPEIEEELEYVLVEPFDINNETDVKETIDKVNENNKNDDSVKKELSEKMLKFYNGTLTKDDFSGKNDDEIANEVKNFTIELNEVTSASILDYVNLREGETLTDTEKNVKAIGLSDVFDENGYAYETYAKEYDATILNEQKKDIADGAKEDYKENSENFITIMETALKDDNLTKAEKAAVATVTKTQSVLFWNTLTKEQQDYFIKEDQGKYNTAAVDEWFQKYDIETSIDFNKTNGGDKSRSGYVASDKADAEKRAGSTGDNEKVKIETGGKRVSYGKGNAEKVSEPTTTTTETSDVADVPKEELTKKEETTKGGQVVSTTVKVETTSKISEEDVPPETEKETTTTLSNNKSETTTKEEIVEVTDENGDTVLTDDEYNKLKQENLKNALINREMATLGGFAGLALMSLTFSDKIITAYEKISAKIKRKRR